MINVISTIDGTAATLYDCFFNRENNRFYYNYRDTGKLPTPTRLAKYGLTLDGDTFINANGAICHYVSGNWMPTTGAKVGRKGSASPSVTAASLVQSWCKYIASDAQVLQAAISLGLVDAQAASDAAKDAQAASDAATQAQAASDAATQAASDAAKAVATAITSGDAKAASDAAKLATKAAKDAQAASDAAKDAQAASDAATQAANALVSDAIAAIDADNAKDLLKLLLAD